MIWIGQIYAPALLVVKVITGVAYEYFHILKPVFLVRIIDKIKNVTAIATASIYIEVCDEPDSVVEVGVSEINAKDECRWVLPLGLQRLKARLDSAVGSLVYAVDHGAHRIRHIVLP